MLLEIRGLTKTFGGLVAVDSFDLDVGCKEIVGLIGPNGAGKSTLFNLITGIHKPTSGSVVFDGEDITRAKPHQVAKLGIGRTFQMNLFFGEFSVLQNVSASFHLRPHSSLAAAYFGTRKYRENEAYIREQADKVLHMVGLEHVAEEQAETLPHGYQKMLGVARALATQPKLLLLDEPLGGMNPSEIQFGLSAISNMRESGITVLIVEHNMQIMDLCDRVAVVSFGKKICEGLPHEVREDSAVVEAYFGGGYAA
jgi:branched-chain amino acid transport system ATP-binding protein